MNMALSLKRDTYYFSYLIPPTNFVTKSSPFETFDTATYSTSTIDITTVFFKFEP